MRLLTFFVGMVVIFSTSCKKPEDVPAARDADEGAGVSAMEVKAASAPVPPVEEEENAAPTPKASADTEGEKTDAPADSASPPHVATPSTADAEKMPEPGSPFLFNRDGLRISGLVLAKGFEKSAEGGKREPVEPGHVFPSDERRVYVIVDLENPSALAGELQVGWIKPGDTKEGNGVSMTLTPHKQWRTFAFNRYPNQFPGVWQVVIRDSDNTVLARASFEMQAAE